MGVWVRAGSLASAAAFRGMGASQVPGPDIASAMAGPRHAGAQRTAAPKEFSSPGRHGTATDEQVLCNSFGAVPGAAHSSIHIGFQNPAEPSHVTAKPQSESPALNPLNSNSYLVPQLAANLAGRPCRLVACSCASPSCSVTTILASLVSFVGHSLIDSLQLQLRHLQAASCTPAFGFAAPANWRLAHALPRRRARC